MNLEEAVKTALPVNAFTKKPYGGANAQELLQAQEAKKFKGNVWATFVQWQQLGFFVNKGEKGTSVVIGKYNDENEFEYRGYKSVFNIAQVSKAETEVAEDLKA